MFKNWINKKNSNYTVVFSILQFDSRGKQFGSNILTRIRLSVKIKLKKFICVRRYKKVTKLPSEASW